MTRLPSGRIVVQSVESDVVLIDDHLGMEVLILEADVVPMLVSTAYLVRPYDEATDHEFAASNLEDLEERALDLLSVVARRRYEGRP